MPVGKRRKLLLALILQGYAHKRRRQRQTSRSPKDGTLNVRMSLRSLLHHSAANTSGSPQSRLHIWFCDRSTASMSTKRGLPDNPKLVTSMPGAPPHRLAMADAKDTPRCICLPPLFLQEKMSKTRSRDCYSAPLFPPSSTTPRIVQMDTPPRGQSPVLCAVVR